MGQNRYNGYDVRAGADCEPEFVNPAPDFKRLRRIVKDSAYWYQRVIEINGRYYQ